MVKQQCGLDKEHISYFSYEEDLCVYIENEPDELISGIANGRVLRRKALYTYTGLKSHYPPGTTTMLATSKNVLFPGHNHLLTTGDDDLTLWLSPEHQWFLEVASDF